MKFLFMLGVMFSVGAVSAEDLTTCSAYLSNTAALRAIIKSLRDRGYHQLTNQFDAKAVDAEALAPFVSQSSPWVVVGLPRLGRKRPILRHASLHVADGEFGRQVAEWAVIQGLFKIELHARLRERPPRATSGGWFARPAVVGRYQAGRVAALLNDLYRAIGELTVLNPAGRLDDEDPGRYAAPVLALLKGRPDGLAANQHDLNSYYLSGADEALKSAIHDRYDEALMWAQWRGHVLRGSGTVAALGLLSTSLSLLNPADPPPALPDVSTSQLSQNGCIPESQMTDAQKDSARAKLKHLTEQLERARRKADPVTDELEAIKQLILDHTNCNPFLLLPGESAR